MTRKKWFRRLFCGPTKNSASLRRARILGRGFTALRRIMRLTACARAPGAKWATRRANAPRIARAYARRAHCIRDAPLGRLWNRRDRRRAEFQRERRKEHSVPLGAKT